MVRIEQMGADDWERVRAVRLRALADAPDAFWTTYDEASAQMEAHWRARLARPDTVTFVASRDGADVGLVIGAPHHHYTDDAGLYAMWVDPHARGSGVAVALIHRVIDWARAAGYRLLRLDVADANVAAIRRYERMGFTPTGMVTVFPAPRDHIVEHERALNLIAATDVRH